ncbi:MAG TPA: AcvB/VirJ family lysyl-phosphatidylglycerol hydrolase [Steroidobacteraceae bacterium]|nr:AcvB/VirJ family lysyl-phosphatidylglycerol hydrolase [Steroidobacteraceae bacterium]
MNARRVGRAPSAAVGCAVTSAAVALGALAAPPAAAPAPAVTSAALPAAVTAAAPATTPPARLPDDSRHLAAGRFGTVNVYIPDGGPRSVTLFVSGDGGWELGVIDMAHALESMGAVVIGVDVRQYQASLRTAAQRPGAPCQMIAADFEALSHQLQKQIGMSEYLVPVLVGYSSGASVAYAALVQSPPGTFAGALSLGFCPDQDFAGAALCPGAGLHYSENAQHELVLEPAMTLRQPWIALQGEQDQVCSPRTAAAFAARVAGGTVVPLPRVGHGFAVERNWLPQFRQAYATLAARTSAGQERPADISDLPVEEVHAAGNSPEFALLLSGDGGWAGLDQELAARLAAAGVPTVGFNSLKYFWSKRTPEETARDVARVLRHYLIAWHTQRVLLIGYSFGADVLPFVVKRLPAELRARVASVSLLGIDANAAFEVRVAEWVGSNAGGAPTRPEVAALAPLPVLCIYGAGEADSICPDLSTPGVVREQIGRGHHFSGEYATLAERILAFTRSAHGVT